LALDLPIFIGRIAARGFLAIFGQVLASDQPLAFGHQGREGLAIALDLSLALKLGLGLRLSSVQPGGQDEEIPETGHDPNY
jgi:hypothetical protein